MCSMLRPEGCSKNGGVQTNVFGSPPGAPVRLSPRRALRGVMIFGVCNLVPFGTLLVVGKLSLRLSASSASVLGPFW